MINFYVILPLALVIILLLLKKYKFKDIINTIFYGILAMVLAIIIIRGLMLIFNLPRDIMYFSETDISLFSFFISFILAAFPE